ncbi:beta-galactoside-specific lectin 4-like [Apium graveolens]|uniref:beta-galactoside-specific lectin 4-like n=1 Tax=Apium graveolens TaxID=4045 RepID=UPI003D7ACCDA
MVSRLLFLVVAAAWLVSSICTAGNVVLLMSPERVPEKLTFYPVVPFDTYHATRERYKYFIEHVREEMLSVDKVCGIRRLQNPANLLESDRYLLVALFSSKGARIVLAIDRVNASVVAYRSKYKVYYFPDVVIPSSVFAGITRQVLTFNSSYSAMEKEAGRRSMVKLGMVQLDNSIQLIDRETSYSANSHAAFLLIASQMVSEAIRYKHGFYPNATMIALENNWKELSVRIHKSVGNVIYPGFELPGVSNTITTIYPVLGPQIEFILYVCDDCPKIEPPVNIIGRNGLCADVQDSFYYDANPVILWPCRSTRNGNQLFTLMNDDTIRCHGKCLTAYRLKPDRYVMIPNCTTAPEYSSIKWKVEDNGNIINEEYNLALNAFVGYQWSILTVDPISFSSRQAWSFGNSTSTEPTVTPIVSYNGMYMQAANNSVIVVDGSGITVPQWEIYPDGTIRPSGTKTNCLARKSADVNLHVCDGGTAERWLFHYDGSSITISDATSIYVLEVNKDQKVVVGSAETPTPGQIFSIDVKFE